MMRKFNKWCERKPLVSPNIDEYFQTNSRISFLNISSIAKAALLQHEILKTEGIEIVVFSNIKLPSEFEFANGLIIVPCFKNELAGIKVDNPEYKSSSYMESKSKFIYDGWLPIDNWEHEALEVRLLEINKALSLFSFIGNVKMSWEPKYSVNTNSTTSIHPSSQDIEFLNTLNLSISQDLSDLDTDALYRSFSWLTNAHTTDDTVAEFLFCMLALESMIKYIEEDAEDDSHFVSFKTLKLTKSERRKTREVCIQKTLETEKNLTKAIQDAYFNCIVGIKARMQRHLCNVFSEDKSSLELLDHLFVTKINDKTLYDIRSEIAHGTTNRISPQQIDLISRRIYDIERIAKRYLRKLIVGMKTSDLPEKVRASMNFDLGTNVITSERMYKGSTLMAEYYLNRL